MVAVAGSVAPGSGWPAGRSRMATSGGGQQGEAGDPHRGVQAGGAAARVDDRAEDGDAEYLAELAEGVVHRGGHPGPGGADRRHGDLGHRRQAEAHTRAGQREVPPDGADPGMRPC